MFVLSYNLFKDMDEGGFHIRQKYGVNLGRDVRSSAKASWVSQLLLQLCSIPILILLLYIYPYQNLLVMKTQSTVSGFCYAQNRVCYVVYL